MKHIGTQNIETNRLLLRPFRIDDAQSMYENWANDPEVTKFLMWPVHESIEVSKAILVDWTSHYCERDYYQWAIVLKENGDIPIGSISMVHKDDDIKMVHIGYCIGRKWWHKGITSEALQAIIKFFIIDVGMNRVESRHDHNNPNSGKVMLKCGMKYEGTKREGDWNNQGICDSSEYAIIASEYYNIRIAKKE